MRVWEDLLIVVDVYDGHRDRRIGRYRPFLIFHSFIWIRPLHTATYPVGKANAFSNACASVWKLLQLQPI
jgi:hypothetical protein